jgi:uncharacterized membrane protein YfcA
MTLEECLLAASVGLVALFYASVGHAGATGYVAVMTLWGLAPSLNRPTALSLNVVVGVIATMQFWRAGHFRGRLFLPLAAGSIPAAALGGFTGLPTAAFEGIVGLILLVSALRLVLPRPSEGVSAGFEDRRLPAAFLAGLGVGLGLLSGLTGVGGGVFLTPLLLSIDAAPVRQVAAVSAPFILVNSLAGLAGTFAAGRTIPPVGLPLLVAAVVGGVAGSHAGAFRLPTSALRILMAGVLMVAAFRLLMARFT